MNVLVNDKLHFIRLCTIRSALRLEILGMKRSRSPSAYVLAKEIMGLTGNRKFVFEQLTALIEIEKERQKGKYANVYAIK